LAGHNAAERAFSFARTRSLCAGCERASAACVRRTSMPSRMVGRVVITGVIATIGIGTIVYAVRPRQVVGVQANGRILVPNGQTLTPAGTHVNVNDRPLGMVVSPDGRLLAVVTGSNFNPRALHLIDVQSRTLKQTIAISASFVGVAFSPGGDVIYVGGGTSNDVKIFKATNGTFAADGTIPIAGGPQPSGLTLNADGTRLYVALNRPPRAEGTDRPARGPPPPAPAGAS